MANLQTHPLVKATYDVCQLIEACGASEALTRAVSAAGALLDPIEALALEVNRLRGEPPPGAYQDEPGHDEGLTGSGTMVDGTELYALIAKWRRQATHVISGVDPKNAALVAAQCADDLEAVLSR